MTPAKKTALEQRMKVLDARIRKLKSKLVRNKEEEQELKDLEAERAHINGALTSEDQREAITSHLVQN